MAYLRRLENEKNKFVKNPTTNCEAHPVDNSLLSWVATILGPAGTPYEGGIFKLKLNFTTQYPCEPPQVRFITKIFHPNIDSDGGICLDILKDEWSPILNIEKILLSICVLMGTPNPDDPLVKYSADLYKNDIEKYNTEARIWTMEYAHLDNTYGSNTSVSQQSQISDELDDDEDELNIDFDELDEEELSSE